MIHPVLPYAIAALLFGLGVYGVLARRNAVLILMAVELMLNSVNLVLITADTTVRGAAPQTGAVFALFVIVLAAAEVGVGLAIVLALYRLRRSVRVDEIPLDGGPPGGPGPEPPDDIPPEARAGAVGVRQREPAAEAIPGSRTR